MSGFVYIYHFCIALLTYLINHLYILLMQKHVRHVVKVWGRSNNNIASSKRIVSFTYFCQRYSLTVFAEALRCEIHETQIYITMNI